MSPSHSLSAHWASQIYASWRQTHQDSKSLPSSPNSSPLGGYFAPSSNNGTPPPAQQQEKRSMDSDRGTSSDGSSPMSRQTSASSWFGGRR